MTKPPIDRDIYALALTLLRQHGHEGAGFQAAQRADELLAEGATQGSKMWQRVMRAIDELAAEEPPAGSAKH